MAVAITLGAVLLVLALALWRLSWWIAWRRMSDEQRARAIARSRNSYVRRLVEVNLRNARRVDDERGGALAVLRLANGFEERGDFKAAIQWYRELGIILSDLGSPDATLARDNLDRLRRALGDVEFNRILREVEDEAL